MRPYPLRNPWVTIMNFRSHAVGRQESRPVRWPELGMSSRVGEKSLFVIFIYIFIRENRITKMWPRNYQARPQLRTERRRGLGLLKRIQKTSCSEPRAEVSERRNRLIWSCKFEAEHLWSSWRIIDKDRNSRWNKVTRQIATMPEV